MSSFVSDLKKSREIAELMYVATLYKQPDLYNDFRLEHTHLIPNGDWQFFYGVFISMIKDNKYVKVDNFSVDTFIREKLTENYAKRYASVGGYDAIRGAIEIAEVENMEQYYYDVLKYSSLFGMIKSGFDVKSHWEVIKDFNYKALSLYFDRLNAQIFPEHSANEDKIDDIKGGIKEMIQEADKGVNAGLPVDSACLNSIINGQILGNLTMLAGMSGTGKTFLTIALVLPKIIENKEKLLIMCNEEDKSKWQQQILTWIINNKITVQPKYKHLEFKKNRFYEGRFTPDEKILLSEGLKWMNENVEDGLIDFVNFSTFSMEKAISAIRKHSDTLGVRYFILDTFKLDNDAGSKVDDIAWLQLQQNIVKLYNVIKSTVNNVHVWLTYQLNKTKHKFLDQSVLGMSKNVADVVSTLILTRNVTQKEKDSNTLKIKKPNGGGDAVLDPTKDYMVLFIDKNRSGSTSEQVVLRTDKGRNVIRDVGFTRIAEDF